MKIIVDETKRAALLQTEVDNAMAEATKAAARGESHFTYVSQLTKDELLSVGHIPSAVSKASEGTVILQRGGNKGDVIHFQIIKPEESYSLL